ncbi:hypothetical protein [Streptomyces mirabilis]|uniref:hypothetical protein n=1 Tax=Streptomyces mirabilis TaxID=68239 RepID=UPI0021C19165|nr:hypothetical protein [Streptomyces mirabilis]MCT9105403.1 hypothetical protein [Streptomyces mirabilis]
MTTTSKAKLFPARQRCSRAAKFDSPGWKTLVTAHAVLRSVVGTEEVVWARDLRHLLTHQNGALRTESALTKFRDLDAERDEDEVDHAHVGGKVPLGVPRALKILDSLAAVIRTADAPVWALCWSRSGRADWPETVSKLHEQKCVVIDPA